MATIVKLNELPSILEVWRDDHKIIHCHGCFDVLHYGHVQHFKKSADITCELLIVTVTPDEFVNKGAGRPVFTAQQRAEMIAELECVDYVAINNSPSAVEPIKIIKPDYYVKGADYKDSQDVILQLEKEAVESVGGKLIFTETELYSSTKLINKYFPTTSDEADNFIKDFKTRFSKDDLFGFFDKVKNLKVMVIGEYIHDVYHYCTTLGKSNKEPILAIQHEYSEHYNGGIEATCSHMKNFASYISERSGTPTIRKERFIEKYPFQKIFEVYYPEQTNEGLRIDKEKLKNDIPKFDLIVVNDYGHGMIDDEMVDIICNNAKFLAVNTQTNAGNHGFNTISKYPRADYICLSEEELRLETRNKTQNVECLMNNISVDLGCPKVIITQGNKGLITYSNTKEENVWTKVPAFTNRFVDRVGAGDAVFGITSLLVAASVSMEVVGVIGNAVGALAVDIVGNKESIKKNKLKDFLTTLMK